MKKKSLFGIAILGTIISTNAYILSLDQRPIGDVTLADIETLAQNESGSESGGYSCTVSTNCYNYSMTHILGTISCSGQKCSRGTETTGTFIVHEIPYVECDGHRTKCEEDD